MNLSLKKFDMRWIKDDSVVVMIGKRNTGKSFLCKDLLYYKQDIPVGTVISATEVANSFYSAMVPSLFIHESYQEPIISKAMDRQKRVIEKNTSSSNIVMGGNNFNTKKIDPRAFLILDDCLYDNSWTKSTNIRSLFMNGRHYKMLFLITMQYGLGIPPVLRTNIDYVFLLRENIQRNRKLLYDNYAGMFPNFEMFCSVLDQCTENYECLVICNCAKSNQIEDQVFWYKADQHSPFRLGSKEVWDYSDQHSRKFDDSDKYGNEALLKSVPKRGCLGVDKKWT